MKTISRVLVIAALLVLGVLLIGCSDTTTVGSSAETIAFAENGAEGISPIVFGESGAGGGANYVELAEPARALVTPTVWPIMEAECVPVTQKTSSAAAVKLGLVNPTVALGSGGGHAYDANWVLQWPRMDDCTCFMLLSTSFVDGSYSKGVDIKERVPQLPTGEEARRLAESFLNERGLMGGLQFVDASVKEWSEETPVLMGVLFRPLVNNSIVEGPGAKVVVMIADRGEIIGLEYLAQRWKPAGETPLRPIDDALADITTGKGATPLVEWQHVIVQDVHVASYAEPQPLAKTQLKPVYVFTASNADNPGDPVQKYIVSALPTN
jgi:hypothetical protein